MNEKKDSFVINIPMSSASTRITKGKGGGGGLFEGVKEGIRKAWEFTKEDSDRVIFALKVGLSVLLVSLLILFRAPYDMFGTNIIWAIITVAVMFEYTVGATFHKGLNRALGSLLAGVIAVAVAELGLLTGRVAEPFIIGGSIFIIAIMTSFMKLWPSLSAYEYGFRVMLFTYCLIIFSGYPMGNPFFIAMGRLYSIAIGGIVAVLVNVLVYPIWAGEQLHKELVKSFDSLADSLQECVGKYLEDTGSKHPDFTKTIMDDFPDEPAYEKCRATLNSSAKLDSLAGSAKWEPPHGRFKLFSYPWDEYVKVGAVLRYCAYEVMALHGVLHSEIQAPYNLRITFQLEIQEASNQAAELIRSLGQDINDMTRTLHKNLLIKLHNSTEKLQRAVDLHSYLLTSNLDIKENVPPNSKHFRHKRKRAFKHALSTTIYDVSNNVVLTTTTDLNNNKEEQPIPNSSLLQKQISGLESYREMTRKPSRLVHSWPCREVDAFEGEGGGNVDLLPRMKALESTVALSLATFTSLFIELVARHDHLVEAVDELSKLAIFKHDDVV